jgi:leader peptidase (prepilin peptidase)/N-methyltransferase
MTGLFASQVAIVALALVVGLCVGSFLNVVVHRLPKMMERDWRAQCAELRGESAPEENPPAYNLAVPRSACPECGHRIGALENIPVFSWLALRGACSACRKPISIRYPLVEVLGGLLAAYAIWRFGLSWKGAAACVLLWALTALTFIDFDTQLLPDSLTLPLLWAGLIANLFGLFVPLTDAVIGAVAGYLALWVVYWLFRLIRGLGVYYLAILVSIPLYIGLLYVLAKLGVWAMLWYAAALLCQLSFFSLIGGCLYIRRRQLGIVPSRSPERGSIMMVSASAWLRPASSGTFW